MGRDPPAPAAEDTKPADSRTGRSRTLQLARIGRNPASSLPVWLPPPLFAPARNHFKSGKLPSPATPAGRNGTPDAKNG